MATRHDDPRLPGDLYHGAIDPGRWPELLDRIARTLGARGATVLSVDLLRPDRHAVSRMSTLYRHEHRAFYETELSHHEREHVELVAMSEPGSLVLEPRLASSAHREATLARPDIAFLREHYGVVDRFGVRVNEDGGRLDCLACQYGEGRGNIASGEIETLMSLVPHVGQTLALARTFGALRARYRAVLSVLDRVDVALCLVEADARLVLENRTARALLERDDVVSLDARSRLGARRPDADAALRAGIARAARTATHEGESSPELLALPNIRGGPDCIAEISPVHDTDDELGERFSGAIVTIVDPALRHSIDVRGLDLAYGLSASETAVAALLVDGLTYAEIAETRSVSPETVKSQVGSLLAKTGARNRAGLVRRAQMLNVPIGDRSD